MRSLTVFLEQGIKGFGKYERQDTRWWGCWTAVVNDGCRVKTYRFASSNTLTDAIHRVREEVPGARVARFTRKPIGDRPMWTANLKE